MDAFLVDTLKELLILLMGLAVHIFEHHHKAKSYNRDNDSYSMHAEGHRISLSVYFELFYASKFRSLLE